MEPAEATEPGYTTRTYSRPVQRVGVVNGAVRNRRLETTSGNNRRHHHLYTQIPVIIAHGVTYSEVATFTASQPAGPAGHHLDCTRSRDIDRCIVAKVLFLMIHGAPHALRSSLSCVRLCRLPAPLSSPSSRSLLLSSRHGHSFRRRRSRRRRQRWQCSGSWPRPAFRPVRCVRQFTTSVFPFLRS